MQNVPEKLQCLGCISKQTMHSVVKKTRLNSLKDDFFLSFLHKKKAEYSLDLSLFIFCLLTVYFKPWIAELLSQNICMMIAQKPFCWKWISVTKVSKYGTSEYSRALNASYTRNFSRSKVHLPDLEVCCDCFFFPAQVSRRLWGRNAWRTPKNVCVGG